MKIQLICVGKLKEDYLKKLIDRYAKEIRKKYTFEIIELPDEETPANASKKQEENIIKKEGTRILSRIPSSTEQFQKRWSQLRQEGISCVTFIIGGSLGLSREVSAKGQIKLSFSRLTFPHQLMRLILTEQLSRL